MSTLEVGKFYKLDYVLWGSPEFTDKITIFKISDIIHDRVYYSVICSNSQYYSKLQNDIRRSFAVMSTTANSLKEISQEELTEFLLSI